jgi:hypothetical protein
VPSEIQPLETRAAGTSINTFVNFLFTFLIGQAFLSILCAMKWGTFLFFAGWVIIMTLFVFFCVPETKVRVLRAVVFVKRGGGLSGALLVA